MTGIWLISYVFLWVVVVVFCLLSIGLLYQFGLLQRRIHDLISSHIDNAAETAEEARQNRVPPLISEDGPVIGSALPALTMEVCNDHVILPPTSWYDEHGTIVLFMTPTCESCQHLVEPLNRLVAARVFKGRVVVILRADETACRAFLNLFPLHVPVVCDHDHTITKRFNIHRSPSGLLYDAQGKLVRKGQILTYEAFLALLGDPSVSPEALANIYPLVESAHLLTNTEDVAGSKN